MRKVIDSFLSADKKTDINVLCWLPEKPRAVLQIAHGMVEFADRYDEMARWFAERGYIVVANDHLGHGDSVQSREDWGFFAAEEGWDKVLADMHFLRCRTAEAYPDLPYFLLGHSMGSFLVRDYLSRWPQDNLKGAIIVGTGETPRLLLSLARFIAGRKIVSKGPRYRSKLLTKLVLGQGLNFSSSARERNAWLTRDNEIVALYNADPRNNFVFTAQAFYDFFSGMLRLGQKSNQQRVDKNLPLLFMSGDKDPIGKMGKGVRKACRLYENLGCQDIMLKLYPGARHEILNEINRQEVFSDLLNWLTSKI